MLSTIGRADADATCGRGLALLEDAASSGTNPIGGEVGSSSDSSMSEMYGCPVLAVLNGTGRPKIVMPLQALMILNRVSHCPRVSIPRIAGKLSSSGVSPGNWKMTRLTTVPATQASYVQRSDARIV